MGEVFFTLSWGLTIAYAMQSERTDAGLVKRMEEGSDLRPLANKTVRPKKRGSGQSIKS